MINLVFFVSFIALIITGSIAIVLLYRDSKKDNKCDLVDTKEKLEFMKKEKIGLSGKLEIFKDKVAELKKENYKKEQIVIKLEKKIFELSDQVKKLQLSFIGEKINREDIKMKIALTSKEPDKDIQNEKNYSQKIQRKEELSSKAFIEQKEQIIANKRIQDKLQLL